MCTMYNAGIIIFIVGHQTVRYVSSVMPIRVAEEWTLDNGVFING